MSGDESTCVLEDLEVNHQTAELEPQSKPQQEAQEPAGSGDEAHLEEPMARHERQNSCTSIASTLSLSGDFCKICHCGGEPNAPLIAPCFCSGSLKHVHQDCLQKWIKSSDIKRCELCKYPFAMQSKVKPFSQWEKLDMTSLERRKLLCSVSFHVVAITCVVWSLYILIDRTADEIEAGDLKWPFWTKLVVVAIGFSGGLIFMYIQCKVYIHLCKKWKAYNRIIVVQEAPEEVHKPALKFPLKATQRQSCSKVTTEDDQQSTHTNTAAAAEAGECSLTTATTSMVDARVGRSRSNAETQTALRGVSLMAGGDLLEARVVPVSTLFQDMDRNQPGQGPFFFSECECDNNLRHGNCCKSSSLSAPTSRDGTLKSRCQSRTLTRNDAARTGSWHERRASLRCTLLPGEALHLHSRTPSERIPNTPEP